MAVNPVSGAGYLLAGLRLITRPGLRRFVAIPLGINILVFSAAIYWGVSRFEGLIAWLQSRLPRLPDWLSWLRWLEQGLEWVLWPLFIMLAALLVFYGFTLVANLISAPFNGLLAGGKSLAGDRGPPAGSRHEPPRLRDRSLPRCLGHAFLNAVGRGPGERDAS